MKSTIVSGKYTFTARCILCQTEITIHLKKTKAGVLNLNHSNYLKHLKKYAKDRNNDSAMTQAEAYNLQIIFQDHELTGLLKTSKPTIANTESPLPRNTENQDMKQVEPWNKWIHLFKLLTVPKHCSHQILLQKLTVWRCLYPLVENVRTGIWKMVANSKKSKVRIMNKENVNLQEILNNRTLRERPLTRETNNLEFEPFFSENLDIANESDFDDSDVDKAVEDKDLSKTVEEKDLSVSSSEK